MFNETYYLKKRFYFILFLIVTAIFFIKFANIVKVQIGLPRGISGAIDSR